MSPGTETGGILIGYHKGIDIEIVRASNAGPNAIKSACTVLRDTEYCQAVLQQEFEISRADYVGEWHTHVVDLQRPSTGDIQTLAGIIMDPDYDFQSFAMILVNASQQSISRVAGYMATREDEATVEIIEVPIVAAISDCE